MKAYDDAVAVLKSKFRELDTNRDGMLSKSELAVLLRRGQPDISEREIRGLFLSVDKDGSGYILFEEFVDFLFRPPTPRDLPPDTRPPKLGDAKELSELRRASAQALPQVSTVEISGSTFHEELNGVYVRKPGVHHGRPVFARSKPASSLFFGWTEGRRREGWFLAPALSNRGPAIGFLMFSPSARAQTPDRCASMWETAGGNRDKRMFCEVCEAVDRDVEDGGDDGHPASCPEDDLQEPHVYGESDGSECSAASDGCKTGPWDEEAGEDIEDVEGLDTHEGDFRWDQEGAADDDIDADPLLLDDYIDPDFPPEESSLGTSMGLHDLDTEGCVADDWARLPRLHERPCLFDRVSQDDISFGDREESRWFLAACAAVAEFPAWIESMFGRTQELECSGRYSIRFFHPGRREFVWVRVDDFVPTKKGSPAFSGITLEGEVWVALVEKAFAKLCGSYGNLDGGTNAFGMFYLCGGGGAESWTRVRGHRWRRSYTVWTGRAPKAFNRKRSEGSFQDAIYVGLDRLWSRLLRYSGLCYPMAVTLGHGPDEVECGLLPDRAYSLISAREVPVGSRVLRMVFLRNPFGVGKWRGRWGEESAEWEAHPAIRHALRYTPRSDGAFWMSFADFVRHFEILDVVKKAMPVQGCHAVKLAGLRECLRGQPSLGGGRRGHTGHESIP